MNINDVILNLLYDIIQDFYLFDQLLSSCLDSIAIAHDLFPATLYGRRQMHKLYINTEKKILLISIEFF